MVKASQAIAKIVIFPVKLYQWVVSPFLGHHCRFYPSCSQYCIEAIQSHGIMRGCLMTLKRLLKCHPWHAGGFDSVPPPKES